jgi:hypothetical protein
MCRTTLGDPDTRMERVHESILSSQTQQEQHELERDLMRAINSRLHVTMQCTAGLCEYCERAADICIRYTREDVLFSHACLTHKWECLIDMTINNDEEAPYGIFQTFNLNRNIPLEHSGDFPPTIDNNDV